MLNHFDTVFAFVAVMTGVSLIVTSLTQMMGALFGLRGRHLRWGIGGLLENYLPELKGYGDALSGHLLNHPLVSDSMFSRHRWVPMNALGRAMHFLWRGWKYATVVRSDELVAIVSNLAENVEAIVPAAKRGLEAIRSGKPVGEVYSLLIPDVRAVASKAGLASHWIESASRYVTAANEMAAKGGTDAAGQAQWVKELETFFQAVVGIGILAKRLEANRTVATEGTVDSAASGSGALVVETPAAPGKGLTLGPGWNRWFDGTMDRVSERFSTSMRVWTIVFSILVAFWGGLDALSLFNRLSADPEYRAMIVSGMDGVAKRAGDMTTTSVDGETSDDAQAWQRLENQVAELKVLIQANADLGIFSPRDPFADWPRGFLGRAASAMLLSLGAPFWFNALKKMANLRPSLANKEEGGK